MINVSYLLLIVTYGRGGKCAAFQATKCHHATGEPSIPMLI